jgi:hypothetical protein
MERASSRFPRLYDMCLEAFVDRLGAFHELAELPEPVVIALLGVVLRRQMLTPKLARVFVDSRHPLVVTFISALDTRPPVIVDSTCEPRGARPQPSPAPSRASRARAAGCRPVGFR